MVMTGKTWVFWLGLLIFATACVALFSTIWYYSLYAYGYFSNLMVPPIVGAVVFILVGLYMMYSGRNRTGSSAETQASLKRSPMQSADSSLSSIVKGQM